MYAVEDDYLVCVLVSLLGNDAADIGHKGALTALDSHGRTPPLVFEGEYTKREFSLSIDPNCSLSVVLPMPSICVRLCVA